MLDTGAPLPVVVNKMLQEQRDKARAAYEQAVEKQSAGDVDGAVHDFSMAIHLDPTWSKPYFERGCLKHRQGDLDKAANDFTQAIKNDPGYVRAYAKRAMVYLAQRDYEGAENDLSKVLETSPDHLVLLTRRIEARLALGWGWKALDDTNRLLELEPESPEGLYLKAQCLEKVDDDAGAELSFREAGRLGHALARKALRDRYGGL
jgi:Flp pilus assembly protein TadD